MRVSDGVMVRTRSFHREEREVEKEKLDKSVGVPWDPTEDGEHVVPAQQVGEEGMPTTRGQIPRNTVHYQ